MRRDEIDLRAALEAPDRSIQQDKLDGSALAGRWEGSWGPDGLREVLVLQGRGGMAFGGTSYFESRRGQKYEPGRVQGTVAPGQIRFQLTRPGGTFAFVGVALPGASALAGQFTGYSNRVAYRRS